MIQTRYAGGPHFISQSNSCNFLYKSCLKMLCTPILALRCSTETLVHDEYRK